MNNLGICNQVYIPMRGEPSEKAEMVSQLIFGEKYIVKEEKENWIQITNIYDNYVGWIDKKLWLNYEDNYPDFYTVSRPVKVLKDNIEITLSPGSELPNINDERFILGNSTYMFPNNIKKEESQEQIIDIAYQFLNTPYLWGGKSIYGIDCSGFTQMVTKIMRVKIPRDASQQVNMGESLPSIDESKPADLVFFENKEGKITHVGLLLENRRVIHASGCVRIDSIDEKGIFNTEKSGYTHKLHSIKRIFMDSRKL